MPTPPEPVALQLHVAQALVEARPRSTYTFLTYILRSDDVWEDVTAQTTWSSPDPAVFRSLGSGRFMADSPGHAGVRAEYAGFASFMDVIVIDPLRLPVPRLVMVTTNPWLIGSTGQAGVTLIPASGGSRSVTAEAEWSSSDPSVATIDRGRVTAIRPGTTQITASYQALTASYVFSVRPSQR